MRSWIALPVVALAFAICAPDAYAQPAVERLKSEVAELKGLLAKQRADFERAIGDLKERLDRELADEVKKKLETYVDDIVARKSKFYRRPPAGSKDSSINYSVFDALEGGLIFSGLFRTRFEHRGQNVDFNSGDSGLDDEGPRFNGRFRLGFGAVIVRGLNEDRTKVTALTEFQAVGTFANNTYFSFSGPSGVPVATEFTIFKEPFEQVGLYQGFMSFDHVLGDDIFLRLGRQEVILPEDDSNEFIFGNNSFYDGTVHDGLLLTWAPSRFSLSGFYFKEAQSDTELAVTLPADDFDEDWLAGFYASWKPGEATKTTVDFYALYFDARSNFTDAFVTRTTALAFDGALTPPILGHFWTLGGRLLWSEIDLFGGLLQVNAEAAFQTGNNGVEDAVSGGLDEQSIHGWSTEVLLNYWVQSEDLQPIVSLSYYYAGGGSENPGTATGFPPTHIGFQPLFINRHFDRPVSARERYDKPYHSGGGRYGNMDLIPLTNMHIVKAAVSISPADKLEIGLAGVMAITADNEGWGTGVFGYEVDLFGSYDYKDYIRFSANLSVFFPESTATDMSEYYFFSGTGLDGEPDNDIAFAFYIQALIAF